MCFVEESEVPTFQKAQETCGFSQLMQVSKENKFITKNTFNYSQFTP